MENMKKPQEWSGEIVGVVFASHRSPLGDYILDPAAASGASERANTDLASLR